MAIIITKNAKAAINNNFIEQSGICRQTTIKIHNDGSVATRGVLNLGNVGDNLVTTINIDTTNLIWNNLANSGINLFDAYQPLLIFQDSRGGKTSIEFEGNYFSVPKEITEQATTYNIIYALKERTIEPETHEGNVGGESEEEYQEVFVSEVFQGVVHDSIYSLINDADITDLDPDFIVTTPSALQKPELQISWTGTSGLTSNNSFLGNKQDDLITPLKVVNFPNANNLNGEYTIYFLQENVKYKYTTTYIPLNMWIPGVLTTNTSTWIVGLEYKNDEVTAYTNTIVMGVKDNFLTPDDIDKDIEQLLWADLQNNTQEVLQVITGEDENGNPIYQNAQTYELSGSSYQLQFTGSEIDSYLGWVKSHSALVDQHINNDEIHVTQSNKDDWSAATEKINSININDYVKTEALSDYATKEELNDYLKEADLSDFVTIDGLSDYAKKEDLSDYAKQSDLSALSNVVGDDKSGLIQDVNELHKEIYGDGENTSRIDGLEESSTQHNALITNTSTRVGVLESTVYGSDQQPGLSSIVAKTAETVSSLSGQLADKASQTYVGSIDGRVLVLEQDVADIYSNVDGNETGILVNKLQDYTTTEVLSNSYETKNDAQDKQEELQNNIDAIYNTQTDSGILTTKINNSITNYDTQATTKFLSKSAANNFIENNSTLGADVFVAKIVFLKSQQEYDDLENKDPNTLYLIQEEE